MPNTTLIQRLFEAAIEGDRVAARRIVTEFFDDGADAEQVQTELLWEVHERVDRLHRDDQISKLSYNFATRLLRALADQVGGELVTTRKLAGAGRRVFAACGPAECEELSAQMATDLLEAHGFDVRFAGGGVAHDEILNAVNESRPDVLLLFGSAPSDLPGIRAVIDALHEIGACPEMQIVVGGGVFGRADGLAEEIGADLWADNPLDLVDTMLLDAEHRAPLDQRTVGRTAKIGRRASTGSTRRAA